MAGTVAEAGGRPRRSIRQTSPGPVVMHGWSDRSHLWIRAFAAPILLGAAAIADLLAALLWGRVGQNVAWGQWERLSWL